MVFFFNMENERLEEEIKSMREKAPGHNKNPILYKLYYMEGELQSPFIWSAG